jgi:hypothetical protein
LPKCTTVSTESILLFQTPKKDGACSSSDSSSSDDDSSSSSEEEKGGEEKKKTGDNAKPKASEGTARDDAMTWLKHRQGQPDRYIL